MALAVAAERTDSANHLVSCEAAAHLLTRGRRSMPQREPLDMLSADQLGFVPNSSRIRGAPALDKSIKYGWATPAS